MCFFVFLFSLNLGNFDLYYPILEGWGSTHQMCTIKRFYNNVRSCLVHWNGDYMGMGVSKGMQEAVME